MPPSHNTPAASEPQAPATSAGGGGWGGRWEVGGEEGVREVGFGAVPDAAVRLDTGAGGSTRYSVKVLLKRP